MQNKGLTRGSSSRFQLRTLALVLPISVFFIYSLSPAVNSGDSRLAYPTAVSIYRSLDLAIQDFPAVAEIDPAYDTTTTSGEILMAYPWPTAVFLIPSAAFADAFFGVEPKSVSISSPNQTWPYEVLTAAALMAVATRMFLSAVQQHGRRAQVISSVGLAFGSVWWSAVSRGMSQHAAAAPFVVLMLVLLVRSRTSNRHLEWLGAVVALAFVMRPTMALAVAACSVWIFLRHRDVFTRYVLTGLSIGTPFLLVNLASYGDLLPGYYRTGPLFEGNVLSGLTGILLSPSRGLLIASPVVVIAVFGFLQRFREKLLDDVDLVLVAIVILNTFVVASWPNWWGGSTFGPRLLAESMPIVFFYVAEGVQRLSLSSEHRGIRKVAVRFSVPLLLLWSIFVNLQGAAVRSTLCWNARPMFIDNSPDRLWDWSDPQFLRGVNDLKAGVPITKVIVNSCSN